LITQDGPETIALELLPEIYEAHPLRLKDIFWQCVGIDVINSDDEIGDANPCFMKENLTRDFTHGTHLSGNPFKDLRLWLLRVDT
jgi:hypothetical protein